jgi:hypothetical protein
MLLLALAQLSVERPGWDMTLNELALKVDNNNEGRAEMYDSFRKLSLQENPPTLWDRLITYPPKV